MRQCGRGPQPHDVGGEAAPADRTGRWSGARARRGCSRVNVTCAAELRTAEVRLGQAAVQAAEAELQLVDELVRPSDAELLDLDVRRAGVCTAAQVAIGSSWCGSSSSQREISIRQCSTERGNCGSCSRNRSASGPDTPLHLAAVHLVAAERLSTLIQVRSVYGARSSAPLPIRMPACTSSTGVVMSARSTWRPIRGRSRRRRGIIVPARAPVRRGSRRMTSSVHSSRAPRARPPRRSSWPDGTGSLSGLPQSRGKRPRVTRRFSRACGERGHDRARVARRR